MVRFFIFIFILLLENLILPAVIGPSQFFITIVFIFSLLMYGKGWRTLLYQIIPFVLITEFFTGENFGHLAIPFGITGVIYIMINKLVNLDQNLGQTKNFLADLITSTVILVMFSYIYAGLYILFNISYGLSASWYEFTIFFKSSLLSLAGWSILIPTLFKYVLKKK